MQRLCYFLVVFLFVNSCEKDKRGIERIDFETPYMFSSEIEEKAANDTVAWKYQNSASDYAMKADYENALINWDLAFGTSAKEFSELMVDSVHRRYTTVNAKDFIIEQSKSNQVIVINEAHHNSRHRVFTKSLLKELYQNGYSNLGLEALSNGENLDSLLNRRKYPVIKTGYYTRDPQFGNLVRDALEIGYTVFAYESTGSGENSREIDQARNIEKVIKSKPNEKFIIHSGFDHALEGSHEYWGKAMAGRLAEYAGINPLTIDQVEFSEKSRPEFSHPLLSALEINESTVLLDGNNLPLGYRTGEAWTDIAVFHPETEYLDSRPKWLFDNEYQNLSIDLAKVDIEFPVMVFAFKQGEDISTAIPIDIVEVGNRMEDCTLGLSKGVYDIVVTNRRESLKFEKKVE